MVRVYERWDRVRRMVSPEGYAYRIAVNLHHRRLRWLRPLGRQPPQSPVDDPAGGAEARTDVMRALLKLPAGQRAAPVLVEWLGMTAEEAGRVLGVKAGSVRARLHRGRKAFRHHLGEGYV
jgi:DNA-directed RNA polymerase specialized sigma24 family protein